MVGLFLLTLMAFWANSPLPGRWLVASAVRTAAERGWNLSVARTDIRSLGAWDFADIHLSRPEPPAEIRIARAGAVFDWWSWILQKAGSPLARVDLDGVTVRATSGSASTTPKDQPASAARPGVSMRRWIPTAFSIHRLDLDIRAAGGPAILVEHLRTNAEAERSGILQCLGGRVSLGERILNVGGVHGVTAWREGVLYLGGLQLREGVTIDNLRWDLAALLEGRLWMESEWRAGGGWIRAGIETDPTAVSPVLDATLWIHDIALDPLGQLLHGESSTLRGVIRHGRFTFRGRPSRWREASAAARVEAEGFRWREREFSSLQAAATLAGGWVQIYEFDLAQHTENRFTARGETSLPATLSQWPKESFWFEASGDIPDPAAFAGLFLSHPPELGGRVTLKGFGQGRKGELSGNIECEGDQLAFRGVTLEEARIALTLAGNEVRVTRAEFTRGKDFLRGTGMVDITGEHRYSAEAGLEAAAFSQYRAWMPENVACALAKAGPGRLQWNGDGTISAHTGGFELKAEGLDLSREPPPALKHPVDIRLSATYSPESVVAKSFSADSGNLRLEGSAWVGTRLETGMVRLVREKTELASGKMSVAFAWPVFQNTRDWRKAFDPAGFCDGWIKARGLDLGDLAKIAGQAPRTTGKLDFDATISGSPNAPVFNAAAAVARPVIAVGERSSTFVGAGFKAHTTGSGVAFEARLDAEEGRSILLNGELALLFSGLWDHGRPWIDGARPIRLDARIPATRLDRFQIFLPQGHRLEGKLEGAFTVENTLDQPVIRGSLTLAEGALQWADWHLENLSAQWEAADSGILMKYLAGEMDAAPFTISGNLTPGGKAGVDLDLVLAGKALPVMRSDVLHLFADPTLTVRGPIGAANLAGELALVKAVSARPVEIRLLSFHSVFGDAVPAASFPEFQSNPGLPPHWMLDLRIVTPAPVRVTGGLGVVEADLRVNGPGEAPVLGGRITVREGSLSLPSRKLDGGRGRIDFDPAHPGDPALDLQARCRVPGHGISLAVQNRFSTREVRLQTDPPLSPQETIRKLMPSVTRVSGMDRTAPVPEPWTGSVAPADPMRAPEFRYTWRVR